MDRSGRIDLRRFYLRRTMRIFPAYYVYLGVLLIAAGMGLAVLRPAEFGHAATYTANYFPNRSWFTDHAWSLAVEEQFYLLWPFALFLLGKRRGLMGALAVVVLVPLVRLSWWRLAPGREEMVQHFECVADALATGCLLAGLREELHRRPAYLRFLGCRAFALVPLVFLAASAGVTRPRLDFLFGGTLSNVCAALCIDWALMFSQGFVGRLLNARPLAWVGMMSYSLYLWQQPFLNRQLPSMLTAFPWNLGLAFLAAAVSYHWVEKPLLRLRASWEAHLFGDAVATRPRVLAPVGADASVGPLA